MNDEQEIRLKCIEFVIRVYGSLDMNDIKKADAVANFIIRGLPYEPEAKTSTEDKAA